MKFLFLLENYNWYYTRYFTTHPRFKKKNYAEQLKKLIQQQYYQSDSMGAALEAQQAASHYIIPHCYPLQQSWAKDHKVLLYSRWILEKPVRSAKARILKDRDTFGEIAERTLTAQVKKEQADVVYIHSGIWLSEKTIQKIKANCGALVLQWSCPIGNFSGYPFHLFDFICTSSVTIKKHFDTKGIAAYMLQQAFDKRILERVSKKEKTGDVVFIGSVNPLFHSKRIELLNYLLEHIPVAIYCPEDDSRDKRLETIMKHRISGIGGKEMFEAYSRYKIALHMPGDDFLGDAGAKRLFEVTGIGTMLLTLHQENIGAFLEEGKELITFTDGKECLEKIRYYLEHAKEREAIAAAGQKRTLAEHTFENRSGQLMALVKKHMRIKK